MHRWHLFREDRDVIVQAAHDLGTFLYELHHIPLKELHAAEIQNSITNHSYDDWLKLYDDVKQELFPSMTSSIQDWADTLFRTIIADNTMMDYQPRCLMGELSSSHIIFDDEKKAISGIIDFRTSGLGDPAFDIAYILDQYGEEFTNIMQLTYKGSQRLMQRARFIAETFSLQWALGGIRTGNPYWYMLHLGKQKGFRSAFIKQ
jgi:aminoglycoside 2''-phosphotransferase